MMATSELCTFCFNNGIALPKTKSAERELERIMHASDYRPPLDPKPDWHGRADFDLDCTGNQMKAGS